MKKTIILLAALAAALAGLTACSSGAKPDVDWPARISTVADMASGAKSMEMFVTPSKNILCMSDAADSGSLSCMRVQPKSVPTTGVDEAYTCMKNPEDATVNAIIKVRRNSGKACWRNTDGASDMSLDDLEKATGESIDSYVIDARRGATLRTENREFVCAATDDRSVLCVTADKEYGFFVDDAGFKYISNGELETMGM
ncbi:hypothetical protein [Gordonia phthalatica]|uniref:Lipoprotein n=1 Tax=Gordonia phthalatica TaxID=1136941 RepID=A0A0N9N6B7_9ACTN|nr:hypothetical protein [Gordonia phthalatica]ALG83298.1 hypothetical protein ACH46_00715 [Gordonia phthalatica]